MSIVVFGTVSLWMGSTFDTSWDGQGYHQTAVIALTNGWNPIFTKNIDLQQELPSQIFAESYPPAVWEVESSVYSLVGKINSSKIVNVVIGVIAFSSAFIMLRKLNIQKYISALISSLVVLQPLYLLQLLTFMQDGFGYQLLVIGISSLVVYILDRHSLWSVLTFIFSVLMLVSTKYSHLPVALILGVIFVLVSGNRYLNKEYRLSNRTMLLGVGVIVISLIFSAIPYLRNTAYYRYPFYPTNIPDLSGAVTYNNLPHNLQGTSKPVRLFYGMFSKSQSSESGDPRTGSNTADLKVPFTFTIEELQGSTKLYNNRAGAAGPLYSGIIVVSLLALVYFSFKAKDWKQRYAVYSAYFAVGLTVLTSLLVPTPNLLRYVSQIQLIPFIVIVTLLIAFKTRSAVYTVGLLVFLVVLNISLYGLFVIDKNISEAKQINMQYQAMRNSGKTYRVKALHFYSSYKILA